MQHKRVDDPHDIIASFYYEAISPCVRHREPHLRSDPALCPSSRASFAKRSRIMSVIASLICEAIPHLLNEILRQVAPFRINRIYEGNFLGSGTIFNLFFASDSRQYVSTALKIDKFECLIPKGKISIACRPMLMETLDKVTSHACIKNGINFICQDVDTICLVIHSISVLFYNRGMILPI